MYELSELLAMKKKSAFSSAKLISAIKRSAAPGVSSCEVSAISEQLSRLGESNIMAIGYFDKDYPASARRLSSPPLAIYCMGDSQLLRPEDALAVVGTRKPSPDAVSGIIRAINKLNPDVVISGMAYGCDWEAHRAALELGIPTIAVLGCGVAQLGSAKRQQMADDIIAGGGLLCSEYPPSVPTSVGLLMARNRLIVALAERVLVTQTGSSNGSWVSVKEAIVQEKELLSFRSADAPNPLLDTPLGELPAPVRGAFPKRIIDPLKGSPAASELTL